VDVAPGGSATKLGKTPHVITTPTGAEFSCRIPTVCRKSQ
jgi:hypothetical protein